jgi:hypothetical protein
MLESNLAALPYHSKMRGGQDFIAKGSSAERTGRRRTGLVPPGVRPRHLGKPIETDAEREDMASRIIQSFQHGVKDADSWVKPANLSLQFKGPCYPSERLPVGALARRT